MPPLVQGDVAAHAAAASTSRATSSSNDTDGAQPSFVAGFRGIADEVVQLSLAALERLVDAHVRAPVEAHVRKGDFDELADTVQLAGRDDVVVRLVLLHHQPHRLDIVARVSPVALRIEIAEHELLLAAGAIAATPCATLLGRKSSGRRGDSWL